MSKKVKFYDRSEPAEGAVSDENDAVTTSSSNGEEPKQDR